MIRAGIQYFVMVFTVGFVLGTGRVVLLAPKVGETVAVVLELPVILAASWWLCGRLVSRHRVPARWPDRLGMGGIALALMMGAEWALALGAFGRSPAEQWAGYGTFHGALGLGGQLLFGLFPLLRLPTGRDR